MRMRYGCDTNNYVLSPRVTYHCVVFIRRTFFDIFQNLGADGKGLAVSCGLDTKCYVLCGCDTYRYGISG